jgi:hypothetical protein
VNYLIADFEKQAQHAWDQAGISHELGVEQTSYQNEHVIFVNWFAQNEGKWTAELVRLAGLAVYGWMPTILRAEGRNGKPRIIDFAEIAKLLNSGSILKEHYSFLNRSVVGTSKFLHFWRPEEYAIWDSKIWRSLKVGGPVNSIDSYVKYLHDIHLFCSREKLRIREVEFALFNLVKNGQT